MVLVDAVRLQEAKERRSRRAAGLLGLLLEVHRLFRRHLAELDVGRHQVDHILLPLGLVLPVVAQLLDGADRLAEVLGTELRVLFGAALLGGDLDHELMGVDGDRHLRHLLVVEELVERVARLGVGLLLVKRLRLSETRPGNGQELVGAGLLDGLLERFVRKPPALRLDKRLAGVHELPRGVGAVRAEHLGVDLGAFLLHAHLDERLRELGLGVLGLERVGERL